MKINENTCPGINWQRPGVPPPSQALKSFRNHLKSMEIHVMASIGNVQASPHPSKPSNLVEIRENRKSRTKSIRIHVPASIGNVQASPHPIDNHCMPYCRPQGLPHADLLAIYCGNPSEAVGS